jgi:hypothetical protein
MALAFLSVTGRGPRPSELRAEDVAPWSTLCRSARNDRVGVREIMMMEPDAVPVIPIYVHIFRGSDSCTE